MAKKNKNLLVKLVSTAGTGFYWVKKRNPKTQTEKLAFKKYDPKVRKHVLFKEEKLKSLKIFGSKNKIGERRSKEETLLSHSSCELHITKRWKIYRKNWHI